MVGGAVALPVPSYFRQWLYYL